jgi:hypothetical protein
MNIDADEVLKIQKAYKILDGSVKAKLKVLRKQYAINAGQLYAIVMLARDYNLSPDIVASKLPEIAEEMTAGEEIAALYGIALEDKTVTLQPITMRVPSELGIYAPSLLKKPVEIKYTDFVTNYADNPYLIRVSLASDGISDWQYMTAYGLDRGWYIEQ